MRVRKRGSLRSVGQMAYQRGRYYYRSRRKGGRVITEYLGTGALGRVLAECDSLEKLKRDKERREIRERREFERHLDECTDAAGDLVRTMTEAVLLCEGYRKHKGQWRKQRK